MTVLKKNTQFEYHQYNGWQIIIGQASLDVITAGLISVSCVMTGHYWQLYKYQVSSM